MRIKSFRSGCDGDLRVLGAELVKTGKALSLVSALTSFFDGNERAIRKVICGILIGTLNLYPRNSLSSTFLIISN